MSQSRLSQFSLHRPEKYESPEELHSALMFDFADSFVPVIFEGCHYKDYPHHQFVSSLYMVNEGLIFISKRLRASL